MTLVIDASVFVAASRSPETNWRSSREFLARVESLALPSSCPSLVLPECAGAVARATGRPQLAEALVAKITSLPSLGIVPLAIPLGERAAALAATYRIKGSDAVYVAVAEDCGALLITWDQEVLQRAAAVVSVQTPDQWLQTNTGPLAAGPT